MPASFALHNAFDGYSDFSENVYFSLKYNEMPTTAELDIDLKPQKTIMTSVLGELALSDWKLEIVFQDWKIARQLDVKAGDDFVKSAFLSSDSASICIKIQTYPESSSLTFYYNHKEKELEPWVLSQITKIRARFGKPATPSFRVLSSDRSGFDTETVNIEPAIINLEENYNESLLEVDRIVQQSIEEQQSGLVLLHGIPGTGKTSYIKTLLTRYREEKFIFVPNDFVEQMLRPDFITFLITQKNSILVIEDAESVIMSREKSQNKSVVSTILQITDGLFSDYLNIKVICTFNTDVSKIDKALFRKGRMIAFYKFEELEEKKAMALLNLESAEDLPEIRTLAELYNLKERSFAEEAKTKTIGFGK